MIEIDPLSDDCITLTEACRLMPRGRRGSRPHLSTLLRWIMHGAPGRDGQRVRLSATRCGARWLTSRSAIRDFCDRLTARMEDLPPAMTPTRKRREDELTATELSEMGI
jgi:hypothetical protein